MLADLVSGSSVGAGAINDQRFAPGGPSYERIMALRAEAVAELQAHSVNIDTFVAQLLTEPDHWRLHDELHERRGDFSFSRSVYLHGFKFLMHLYNYSILYILN